MIWVVGANGMLGTEVCRKLSENKIEYAGTSHEVSITDFSSLETFAKGKKIDFIVNCAAYTAVDKAESEPDLAQKLNAEGPKNLSVLAKKIGAKLIHISTDYVFDGTGDFDTSTMLSAGGLNHRIPYTEDSKIAPIGVYGKTKALGEKEVSENTSEYYILRTAWLYGWNGKNFVYTMIRAMNTHESVKVVSDQRGTPTFCGDLASAIIEIIRKSESENPPAYGIYHFTDLGETTWFDFTNEIKKQGIECGLVTNKTCAVNPCTTSEYPTPAKRPAYSVLSKEKIMRELGIKIPEWQESLSVFLKSENFDKGRLQ